MEVTGPLLCSPAHPCAVPEAVSVLRRPRDLSLPFVASALGTAAEQP